MNRQSFGGLTIHSLDLIDVTDPMLRVALGHSFEDDGKIEQDYHTEWLSTCTLCGAKCQIISSSMTIQHEYVNTALPCSVMLSLQTMRMAGHDVVEQFKELLARFQLPGKGNVKP